MRFRLILIGFFLLPLQVFAEIAPHPFQIDQLSKEPQLLNGLWTFIPNSLAYPSEFIELAETQKAKSIHIPSTWNDYWPVNPNNPHRHGAGVFGVLIELDQKATEPLAVHLGSIEEAYRVWWIPSDQSEQAQLIGYSGWPSKQAAFQKLGKKGRNFTVPNLSKKFWLVFQVSKHHLHSGGINTPVTIAYSDVITQQHTQKVFQKSVVIGAALFMALHYLVFLIYQRRDNFSLMLPLCCLVVAARSYLVSDYLDFIFIDINEPLALFRFRLEYITIVIAASAFLHLFFSSYPEFRNRPLIICSWVTTGILVAAILLFPLDVISANVWLFQAWLFLHCIAFAYCVTQAVTQKLPNSIPTFLGALFIFCGMINDILAYNLSSYNVYLLEYTLLAFLLFQSQVGASRFSAALRASQILSRENTQLTKETLKAKFLEQQDHLTGMFNRKGLNVQLDKSWKHCAAIGEPIAAIIMDADNFKSINDRFGHMAGDEALVFLASAIRGHPFRTEDFFARFGGEEFVIILPRSNLTGANQVAENLRSRIESAVFEYGEESLQLTSSFGIASLVPDKSNSPEILLSNADRALYLAKQNGRNRVESYI